MVDKIHNDPDRKREFPRLGHLNHRVTSPRSLLYNCFAYALGDENRQWKPDPANLYYWPPGARRDLTVASITDMLATFRYVPVSERRVEKNKEKVALFALNGVITHLAKQLPDGKWSSKLGDVEDIRHSLEALEGPHYGSVVQVYARPI